MSELLLDAAGRRRSPATLRQFHAAIAKAEVDNYALTQRVLEDRNAFLAEGLRRPGDTAGPAVSPGD